MKKLWIVGLAVESAILGVLALSSWHRSRELSRRWHEHVIPRSGTAVITTTKTHSTLRILADSFGVRMEPAADTIIGPQYVQAAGTLAGNLARAVTTGLDRLGLHPRILYLPVPIVLTGITLLWWLGRWRQRRHEPHVIY